ncbi:hypothetical protein VNO80_20256 [Phaseolus coccineus]|uniref:Uncharacterized protein n=1 Tax=Phaseolus coccineus TaxID=3886 RepID=A0AAN9R0Z5_PHACN
MLKATVEMIFSQDPPSNQGMLSGTAPPKDPPDESHESGKEKHHHSLCIDFGSSLLLPSWSFYKVSKPFKQNICEKGEQSFSLLLLNMIFPFKNKMFFVLKPGMKDKFLLLEGIK